ncbi:CCA tRNA nucleotidyltransferase [Arcobacter vandammei]|uniref:CCA tRNA nucleotidyltransferase n=1 Tax=Arcobacter vandammei TaxID=2782243 RepID=UPI0018DFA6AC|nr:CCA tRNA nucleotidyltransferase [Arcobacter vandammei]
MYINKSKIDIPEILINILTALQNSGYKPYLVGGCVRDFYLNKEIKDFDIEIFNLNSLDSLSYILKDFGKLNFVGKSFGVLKLSTKDFEFDLSLPRTEQKIGKTHKDFLVKTDSNLTFKEASKRRDFTINAIYYDYFTNSFIDPFFGLRDLEDRKIKHIDDNTFVEDSLRVYRAIGFASRFDFELCADTKKLCKKMVENVELNFLPKERVFEELKKLFLKSQKPSIGLKLLDYFEIFSINFKNFYKSIDNLAEILREKNIEDFRKLYLFFTMILKNREEKEIFDFLNKITNDKKFINNILILWKNSTSLDEKSLKRLSLVLNLEDLIFIEEALETNKIQDIKKLAKDLDIYSKPLKLFICGKDLINLGLKESKEFKDILNYSLDLQIENKLNKEEIIKILINKYKIKSF